MRALDEKDVNIDDPVAQEPASLLLAKSKMIFLEAITFKRLWILGVTIPILVSQLAGAWDKKAINCDALFANEISEGFLEKLEKDGKSFLGTLPVSTETFGQQPAIRIAATPVPENEVVDYRVYVPAPAGLPSGGESQFVRTSFGERLDFSSSPYKYQYCHLTAMEPSVVIQAKDGLRFSLTYSMIPDRGKFAAQEDFEEAVRSLFDRVDFLVRNKITNVDTTGLKKEIEESPISIGNPNARLWPLDQNKSRGKIVIEKIPIRRFGVGQFRYLTKVTSESEKVFTEILDTEVTTEHLARNINTDALSKGRLKQREYLDEVMAFVFPLYAKRRGWGLEFIKKLYKKSFETADNTRYVIIREKTPDGKPGKILAVMGLNRVSYGKVKYFNKITQQWEESTGPFGATHSFENNDVPTFNLDHLLKYGFMMMPPSPTKWWEPTQVLGMESYLNIQVPRPTLIEIMSRPTNKPLESDSRIDFSKGVYFSSGQIYEPIRFGVAKKSDLRGIAYSTILIELFSSIFSTQRSPEMNLHGQYLYFYNTPEGVPLYRQMGAKPVSGFTPISRDGDEWTVLGLSPIDVLAKAKDPVFLASKASEEFAKQLLENLAKLMEKSVVNSEK